MRCPWWPSRSPRAPRRNPARRRRPFAARPALDRLEDRLAPSAAPVAAPAPTLLPDLGPVAARRVVFLEPSVAYYQVLARGLAPGAEAVVLDGRGDGLDQMAAYLRGRTGLASIDIV